MNEWLKLILFYYITLHLIVGLSVILGKENLLMIYIALTIPLYLPIAIISRIKSKKEEQEIKKEEQEFMKSLYRLRKLFDDLDDDEKEKVKAIKNPFDDTEE